MEARNRAGAEGRGPIFGKRVLVPRPKHQAGKTAELLRNRGAEPVVFPLIEIVPPRDPAPLKASLARLKDYDAVAFTSANAVDFFIRAIRDEGHDIEILSDLAIASIGPGTSAALEKYAIIPDIVASSHIGEGIAEAILALFADKSKKAAPRILLPRALVAREELPTMLREAGMIVDIVTAYETMPIGLEGCEELKKELSRQAIDVVLLTSSSTAHSLADALGEDAQSLLDGVVIASIGPIATETARSRSMHVDVSADPFTIPALIAALEQHLAKLAEKT